MAVATVGDLSDDSIPAAIAGQRCALKNDDRGGLGGGCGDSFGGDFSSGFGGDFGGDFGGGKLRQYDKNSVD